MTIQIKIKQNLEQAAESTEGVTRVTHQMQSQVQGETLPAGASPTALNCYGPSSLGLQTGKTYNVTFTEVA